MFDLRILKILFMLGFLISSLIINYFLLCSKKKDSKINKPKIIKYYKFCVLIIVGLNILFFFLDYFLFKNDLVDYIAFYMLLSFMLSITFEDIKTKFMDTRVIVSYFILFLIYRIAFFNITIFLEGLAGFVLSLAIMLIAYFIKRDSIGIGDIEVIAACGMIIGFPNIFHFLFKTFLYVFIFGLILIITKKKNMFSELPLAPFLLIATII